MISERLRTYIDSKGLSVRQFEKKCGLSNGYVNSIKRTITDDKQRRISSVFDDVSMSWLLTGEGPMLKSQQQSSVSNNHIVGNNNAVGNNNNVTIAKEEKASTTEDAKPIVPKYLASQPNTDVYTLLMSGNVSGLTTLRTLPPYSDFDFYYQVRQDAMQPLYLQGDVLALAHLEKDSDIIQGAAMVIDTKDFGFLLRRLYDRGEYYDCKIVNKESVYESQRVDKSKVIRLYKVVYSVRLGD